MPNPEIPNVETPNSETPDSSWDMEDVKFAGEETHEEEADVREYVLPDGTMFKGTPEQYKQEMEDYRDRIA